MDIVPGNHYMHLHSNGDPAQLIASIQQKVLAPLRAFRQQVAPLNDTQITCVQSCATALAALFEGRRSDGLPLMQGAGADALADAFGQFLDSAQRLTGSTPGALFGRLLLASQLSERRADLLEEDLTTLLQQARSSSSVQTGSGAIAGALSLETLASGAEEAAVTLDVGAAAQGGLDLPRDAVAVGASLVAAGLAIAAHFATSQRSSSCTIDPGQVSEVEQKHLGAYSSEMDNARFAQEGRLSGGEVEIRSPAGRTVTDSDIRLDGNQTWAKCKSMAPVTPQDGSRWEGFTRQITPILEEALKRKYKTVAFSFEGPINQAMRDEIGKLARAKGMPVEIFDNQDPTCSSRQRNIPMGTGWCQAPRVQQPPQATPTATPSPPPTPTGDQSGPPPQSSPTPTPTPTAVGTGTP